MSQPKPETIQLFRDLHEFINDRLTQKTKLLTRLKALFSRSSQIDIPSALVQRLKNLQNDGSDTYQLLTLFKENLRHPPNTDQPVQLRLTANLMAKLILQSLKNSRLGLSEMNEDLNAFSSTIEAQLAEQIAEFEKFEQIQIAQKLMALISAARSSTSTKQNVPDYPLQITIPPDLVKRIKNSSNDGSDLYQNLLELQKTFNKHNGTTTAIVSPIISHTLSDAVFEFIYPNDGGELTFDWPPTRNDGLH